MIFRSSQCLCHSLHGWIHPFHVILFVYLAALESKKNYVYGTFSVRAKLPAGYTGGIISTFYLTSSPHCDYRAPHDEIDFEFLGNTTAQSMTIHTNLLSEGMSKLEQVSCGYG